LDGKNLIMGTNYYRIPKSPEIVARHQKLSDQVARLDLWNISKVSRNFSEQKNDSYDYQNAWDEFIEDMNVHLGKRSMGWKFCWNFHKNKFYSNKEELLSFIRSGRVINEYGELQDTEEFINMALTWCEDGLDNQTYYETNPSKKVHWIPSSKYDDKYVDGLRISSSTDFS